MLCLSKTIFPSKCRNVLILVKSENVVLSGFRDADGNANYWLGAKETVNGVWLWVNDHVLSYQDWDPGEPDGNNPLCMYQLPASPHKWNDATCTQSSSFYFYCMKSHRKFVSTFGCFKIYL